MKVPIIVNGANGKMGSIACKAILDHPDFELVARLGRQDNLAQCILDTRAAIVVDLTRADCVYQNALTILEHNAHPVIGTTGLLDPQIQTLREQCDQKKLGGIIVPNFSISAILMMRFAAMAAKFLPDVEIVEAHHQQKLDAPSGTAIKTADMIHNARQHHQPEPPLQETLSGARGARYQEIRIHSIRLPGILARQQVIFGNLGETLTISHDTIDRTSFMPGLLLACQRVLELHTLYYGLEQLIDGGADA